MGHVDVVSVCLAFTAVSTQTALSENVLGYLSSVSASQSSHRSPHTPCPSGTAPARPSWGRADTDINAHTLFERRRTVSTAQAARQDALQQVRR